MYSLNFIEAQRQQTQNAYLTKCLNEANNLVNDFSKLDDDYKEKAVIGFARIVLAKGYFYNKFNI